MGQWAASKHRKECQIHSKQKTAADLWKLPLIVIGNYFTKGKKTASRWGSRIIYIIVNSNNDDDDDEDDDDDDRGKDDGDGDGADDEMMLATRTR